MPMAAFAWWVWIVLGLALLVSELLTPGGFYICFFGAGAIVVGILKFLGLSSSLATDGLLFVLISVAALSFFRKPLLARFRKLTPEIQVDNLTSETASATEDIPPNGHGKVELRGTAWNATNTSDQPILKGQRCKVERVEGLTLFVRSQ
jgi:inner membrane protein